MRRRTIIAIVVALIVFSAVYGMAAGLGGITSSSLGADDVAVASCDSDGVSSGYTTAWDATDERYEVTAVTVSGVSNTCDGQTLSVSLTDAGGAQLGTGNVAIPTSVATSFAVTLSTAASAELTEGIHVLISS
jgi:anti-sigma-K factor RskA